MEKRVVLIVPYFGKFPNYFECWKKSAIANEEFDFLIFTDNSEYKSEKNIKFVYMEFEEFKSIIQRCVKFKINLQEPYKICDYRPLFGQALKEYISKYEFWGFCDVDLIFGDLSHFVTNQILNSYDKVYKLGHLTIIKNNGMCNSLWLQKHHLKGIYRYDEAFSTPRACHFDEMLGLTELAHLKNLKVYDKTDFADVAPNRFNFHLIGKDEKISDGVFQWKEGNLFYFYKLNNKIKKIEVAYAHFQKRCLKVSSTNDDDIFYIIPNVITNSLNIYQYLNRKPRNIFYYSYYKKRIETMLKNILKHDAIKQRLYIKFFQTSYRKKFLDKHKVL